MDLAEWEARYRALGLSPESPETVAQPLVISAAGGLPPARALDLACGKGRNALWLALHGWRVTAVDGSMAAVESLRANMQPFGVQVDTRVANLEMGEYTIEPSAWELIASCYYLQRNLIAPAKAGLVPGGIMVAIALLAQPGRENSSFRARPGELRSYFDGWEILHDREGSDESGHAVAEVVARRPL